MNLDPNLPHSLENESEILDAITVDVYFIDGHSQDQTIAVKDRYVRLKSAQGVELVDIKV